MNVRQKQVVVTGAFDDLWSRHIRFLEEAAQSGPLTVLLWNDAAVRRLTGSVPKFPEAERQYLVQSIRYVDAIHLTDGGVDANALPETRPGQFQQWVIAASQAHPAKQDFCAAHGIDYRIVHDEELKGFPKPIATPSASGRKKVVVTGCYDWFHSGHVRFFEEVSTYGDLYVVIGHDANIRLLKGQGHPLVPDYERRYVVGSVRFVAQALISTGNGWLDAEPEIQGLKPDIYAVNEDGDKGGKRQFCEAHGIQYLVLKRVPAPGLPPRSSTDLRGF